MGRCGWPPIEAGKAPGPIESTTQQSAKPEQEAPFTGCLFFVLLHPLPSPFHPFNLHPLAKRQNSLLKAVSPLSAPVYASNKEAAP